MSHPGVKPPRRRVIPTLEAPAEPSVKPTADVHIASELVRENTARRQQIAMGAEEILERWTTTGIPPSTIEHAVLTDAFGDVQQVRSALGRVERALAAKAICSGPAAFNDAVTDFQKAVDRRNRERPALIAQKDEIDRLIEELENIESAASRRVDQVLGARRQILENDPPFLKAQADSVVASIMVEYGRVDELEAQLRIAKSCLELNDNPQTNTAKTMYIRARRMEGVQDLPQVDQKTGLVVTEQWHKHRAEMSIKAEKIIDELLPLMAERDRSINEAVAALSYRWRDGDAGIG